MITLSEHTVEENLIDKNGWILDLGCVNFSFALEAKKYCNNILCVDPNPSIKEIPQGIFFENMAITHLENETELEFYLYNDIQGHSLLNPEKDWCHLEDKIIVNTTTIKNLMKKYNIEKFEVIKFDIEGSEYKILETIDWTISKQFSIEFHDFRFMNPYYPNNELYYDSILQNVSKHCVVIKHEATDHPGFPDGMGRNYWDSLFIDKNLVYENI